MPQSSSAFSRNGDDLGVVYVDTELNEDIESEGYAREVIRRVQEMRKELDLEMDASIRLEIDVADDRVADLVRERKLDPLIAPTYLSFEPEETAMDEVRRTLDAYESGADAYVEKYLGESIAERYGDAFLAELDGDQLLDVGCGPGPDLETFAGRDYDATGLDLTPSFLRAARDRVPGAALARGDMRRLPFEAESFDGVWSSASLLHVPRADAVPTLREFRRVLRRDGVAFVSVKRGETPGSDPNGRHFEYYRERELRELLADAGLDPVRIETERNWVSTVAEKAPM